ncbi:MAG: hypothetical protein ACOZAO_05470 [Patescibacteria group bacterium]
MKKRIFIVSLVFIGGLFFTFQANAQTICNPQDYCIGTKVQDVPGGCGFNPPGSSPPCYQRWQRVTFTCEADCGYDVYYPAEGCDPNTCSEGAGSWHYTGTCCVNVSDDGDPGDPDDPPPEPAVCGDICGEGSASDGCSNVNVSWEDHSICDNAGLSCASWSDWGDGNCKKVCWGSVCGGGGGGGEDKRRVIGRVYHTDSSGNNILWQPATDNGAGFSCGGSYQTDPNGEHNGTLIISNSNGAASDWACNPGPHYIREAAADGAGPHSFTLFPPSGWECDTWSVTYPFGSYTNASGYGCVATVPLGGDDWDNHLWFKLKPENDPPTAQITNLTDPIYYPSRLLNVSATVSDQNDNLDEATMWRRKYDPNSGTWIGNWVQIGSTQSCSGGDCTITRSWDINSSDVGYWWVAVNAQDTEGFAGRPYSICTGNPGDNPLFPPVYPSSPYSAWSNCGDTSRVRVIVNDPPTGAVRLNGSFFSEGYYPSGGSTTLSVGVAQTFQGKGEDLNPNTGETLKLFRRKYNASTGQWSVPTSVCSPNCWTQFSGTHSCGTSVEPCYMTRSWTPVISDVGDWVVSVNVWDEFGDGAGENGRCSGNPGAYPENSPFYGPLNSPLYPTNVVPGWSNCGDEDFMRVTVNPVSDVQGWLWDSTEFVCEYPAKGVEELDPIAVDAINITTVPTGSSSVSLDGASNYPSYVVQDTPQQNGLSLCADLSEYAQQANATYSLRCVDGPGNSGPLSSTCALIDVPLDASGNPVDVHLGFDLDSKGWFSSLNGDIYAGCLTCAEGITESIPDASVVQGGFAPHLVSGNATTFSNKNIATNQDSSQYAQSNVYLKNINTLASTWLSAYSFIPPENAIQITDCTGFLTNRSLDPANVYEITSSCLQNGLNSLNAADYRIANGENGVVVIYVTGVTEVVFGDGDSIGTPRYFRSSEINNDRIFFVSQVPIRFSADLGASFAGEPSISTRPFVEAAFLTHGSIIFESTGDIETESTIIVEGPLIVGGDAASTVLFERDRGLKNSYPAEYIVYNPLYLTKLTSQELNSSIANYSGLFVSEVYWEK